MNNKEQEKTTITILVEVAYFSGLSTHTSGRSFALFVT